jgi:hypothetical protein
MKPERFSPAFKRAELLGATGVFLLGAGAGAWFGEALAAYAVALIVAGGLIHALAMFGKHRLELASEVPQPMWYRMLYWLCWLLLLLLALWLFLSHT